MKPTLIERLEEWAACQPGARAFGFVDIDGRVVDAYDYADFLRRTCGLASHLRDCGLRRGDRALLGYAPGLELVVAFHACARIGVLAVPLPSEGLGRGREATRMLWAAVIADCAPAALLCDAALDAQLASVPDQDAWGGLRRIVTPTCQQRRDGGPCDPGELLFLQYTSGTTRRPRGVRIGHAAVIDNARAVLDHAAVGVSWLPQFHDMGLIGHYCFPLVVGGSNVGMRAIDFLRRPALWFRCMTAVGATFVAAPDFGFAYCLRRDRLPERALDGVELSSLRVVMNGAEPVGRDTRDRFIARFAPFGLDPHAVVAAYGLAEATLAVTSGGRRVLAVDAVALARGVVIVSSGDDSGLLPRPLGEGRGGGARPARSTDEQLETVARYARPLPDPPPQGEGAIRVGKGMGSMGDAEPQTPTVHVASCGRPLRDIDVRIVDARTRRALAADRVGEIHVAGPSVASGYWRESPATTFGRAGFLRTGDVGFLHRGELFVCGRSDDVIVSRGRKLHASVIEATVASASDAVVPGGVAVFRADEGLVVLAEIRDRATRPSLAAIAAAVDAVHGIRADLVASVAARTLARTTSGKLSRRATRDAFASGSMATLERRVEAADAGASGSTEDSQADGESGLAARLAPLLAHLGTHRTPPADVADLGIDSLMLVELRLAIEGLLERHGIVATEDFDGLDLQRMPTDTLLRIVEGLEAGRADRVAEAMNTWRAAREACRDREQQRMTEDARFVRPGGEGDANEPSAPVAGRGDLLLTGATGFLGPFLLVAWLVRSDLRIVALVRGADDLRADQRVRDVLAAAGLWTADIATAYAARVSVVCGDIALPAFGLSTARYRALVTHIATVCHNAACVDYVRTYEAMRATNVEGTRALLRFAFARRSKAFHFVSTTFVFGWTRHDVVSEDDRNASMNALDFGYAQTKWVAEQLVHDAHALGLPVTIFRPALVSVSSRGYGDRNDVAARLIAFMIAHGIALDAPNQLSLVPVDFTATNIVAIALCEPASGATYHVTADVHYSMADLTRAITRTHGYRFRYLDIPDFVDALNARCRRDDPAFALLDFFNRSAPHLDAMRSKRYDNRRYRQARERLPSTRDDPSIETLATLYVAHLRALGWIGEPSDG